VDALVVIVGTTASGKSQLAMQVAQERNGEIIAADSRTVYKGMDIGTAKPSLEDQKKVRHHLLDVVEPNQKFSAGDFQKLAQEAIKDIHSRGKLPIMVGGTGLYVDSILYDFNFRPANPQELLMNSRPKSSKEAWKCPETTKILAIL
jgi:tRNA dimethylallyltransferase